jgi:RNA-directed DNA polymerase
VSRGAEVMNTALAPRDQWNTMGWTTIERQGFKLQKRIYRTAKREDHRQVRRLQKLLLRSRAANLLAVRKVTQDNQGQKTPGVDGVANLTPPERLALVQHLHLEDTASPVRRVFIPKPGTTEPRPLGIPMCRAYCTSFNERLGANGRPCGGEPDGCGCATWPARPV